MNESAVGRINAALSGRERGLDALSNYASWDVDVDDDHFLMIQFGGGQQEGRRNEFVLVQNWLEEVKARLGG